MMSGENIEHVVLFPFMAYGHLTPFLALAEHLHRRYPSLSVTVVNTPSNIRSLRSSSIPPAILLRSLPFNPADYGLPPNAESNADIPFHLFINLFHASESLRPSFEDLIEDLIKKGSSVCIVGDLFFGWTVDVAKKFRAFHTTFITGGAYGSAIFNSLCTHLPHKTQTGSTLSEFNLPEFPEIRLHRSQLSVSLGEATGSDPWSVFIRRQISLSISSDSMIVNTVAEFEGKGLEMLRKMTAGISLWPVGPLLRVAAATANRSFVDWLDGHPLASVVYVSFGSQNTITEKQMTELAMGLAASGRPFIWVVRPPVGLNYEREGGFKEEWLPEGFDDMTGTRGMVVRTGWAPQVEILSHRSTGAFLSHCGWNSVMESLTSGVPIIGWPLSAEQYYNSTMLEEVGVCVELARGNNEWSKVERGEVERVIEAVMGETEKGRDVRRKAAEVAALLRAALKEDGGEDVGSSLRGLDDFIRTAFSKTN